MGNRRTAEDLRLIYRAINWDGSQYRSRAARRPIGGNGAAGAEPDGSGQWQ
jgi:hypothetical protein